MNNNTLSQAQKWLEELDIRTLAVTGSCLLVNRDDIANLGLGETPEASNQEIINELKKTVSTKLFWGGKDDDWLWLESF